MNGLRAPGMAGRGGAGNASPGSILLVVHDFVARSADELSLSKGDRIELIERCVAWVYILYPTNSAHNNR